MSFRRGTQRYLHFLFFSAVKYYLMNKLTFSFFSSTAQAGTVSGHQRNRSILFGKITFILLSIFSNCCQAQSPVQLAPPFLQYHSIFFTNTANVEIKFAEAGTQIHYTLNNKPPTEKDKIYRAPIQVEERITTVKAIAAGNGFLTSDIVSATFIKDGLRIKSIQQTAAIERFPGTGANTLNDNEGGINDLNSKTWLGFQQDSVEINILMDGKTTIAFMLIDFLQDHGGWIFLPEQVKVFYLDDSKGSFELIAAQSFPANKILSGASCQPIMMAASKKIKTEKIRIVLTGIKALPQDHPGKGEHGWIFIDEIKLY